MQSLKRVRQADQRPMPALGLVEGVRPGPCQGQHLVDQLTEAVCRNPFRQAIDRHQTTDVAGSHLGIAAFQHLNQRVLEGHPIGPLFDQTTDGHRRPLGIQPLLPLEISR